MIMRADIASVLAPFDGDRVETLRPSALARDESIRIAIESVGCFHEDRWVLDWSGAHAPTLEVRELVLDDSGALAPGRIGTTQLLKAEVTGLDATLELYRVFLGKDVGRSTTVQRVCVEYRRGDRKVGQEEFRDLILDMLVDDPSRWESRLPPYVPIPLVRAAVSIRDLALRAMSRP